MKKNLFCSILLYPEYRVTADVREDQITCDCAWFQIHDVVESEVHGCQGRALGDQEPLAKSRSQVAGSARKFLQAPQTLEHSRREILNGIPIYITLEGDFTLNSQRTRRIQSLKYYSVFVLSNTSSTKY